MVIHAPVGVAYVGGDFVGQGQWRTAKPRGECGGNNASPFVRARFRSFLAHLRARQTKPPATQATVEGIKQFLLLVRSCHMYSGLNKKKHCLE